MKEQGLLRMEEINTDYKRQTELSDSRELVTLSVS